MILNILSSSTFVIMKASSVLSCALTLSWALATEYSNPLRDEWGGDPHIVCT